MAIPADPFGMKATLDTSNYGSPTTDRTFGTNTGTQADSGMPVYAQRTITKCAESAEDVVGSDIFSPPDNSVANARAAYLAALAANTRPSLAY